MKRIFLLLAVFILIVGCSFTGDVYVAIHWSNPANMPTAITHNLPNVPAAVGSISPGAYYRTLPGTFNFQTDYPGPVTWTATFTLTEKRTVIGVENVFYDIVCFSTQNPTLTPVPIN